MDSHTIRTILVIGLFAGIFIVVPVVSMLIKSQMKIASLVHGKSLDVDDAIEERIDALERRVAELETRSEQTASIPARLAE